MEGKLHSTQAQRLGYHPLIIRTDLTDMFIPIQRKLPLSSLTMGKQITAGAGLTLTSPAPPHLSLLNRTPAIGPPGRSERR